METRAKRYVILLLQDNDRRGSTSNHSNTNESQRGFVPCNRVGNCPQALGKIRNNSNSSAGPGHMFFWGVVRTNEAGGVPAARGAFFKINEFGMEIVGQRDHKKQQDQSGGESGPLAPGRMFSNPSLSSPTNTPRQQSRNGNHQP
jgi:hypothetical protein